MSAIDFAGILAQSRKDKSSEKVNDVKVSPETIAQFWLSLSKSKTHQSASQFLLALKQAGKRKNERGIMVTIPQEIKGDEVKAISEFMGEYSRKFAHGLQLDAARNEARRLVATGVKDPIKEYSRCSQTTGCHAEGLPDPRGLQLSVLRAQENEAVDALCKGQSGAEVQLKTVRRLIDNLG